MNLRPGDEVDFVVTAKDPEDLDIEYAISSSSDFAPATAWKKNNHFSLKITDEDIGMSFDVSLFIKSTSPYHAQNNCDDVVRFRYSVLPKTSTA